MTNRRSPEARALAPSSSAVRYWLPISGVILLSILINFPGIGDLRNGLHVDSACVAWNGWSIIQTGADQHGTRLPLLDARGFGEGTTTLSIYVNAALESLLGLSPTVPRVSSAASGVAVVALTFYIGHALFGRSAGVIAALLMAVLPWNLTQVRSGHQASLFLLSAAVAVAALLWAGFPIASRPRPDAPLWKAALAATFIGVSFYGYYAARLYLPGLLLAIAVAERRAVIAEWRERRGRLRLLLFTTVLAGIVLPLVVAHFTNPLVTTRAKLTWVWSPADSLAERAMKVAERYPAHFGPSFLFRSGDRDVAYAPPDGSGVLLWIMLPLIAAGLVFAFRRRSQTSHRLVLVLLAVYPAGDLLSRHDGPHAWRAFPGALAFVLIAALGATEVFRSLRKTELALAQLFLITLAFASAVEVGRKVPSIRSMWINQDPARYYAYSTDLYEAWEWIKPRMRRYRAILVSGTGGSHPYIHTLISLRYPPERFRAEQRTLVGPLPNGVYANEETVASFGKVHFLFEGVPSEALDELQANGTRDRVLIVARPSDAAWLPLGEPVHRIVDPAGADAFWITERDL
jgi:hypothetical protein